MTEPIASMESDSGHDPVDLLLEADQNGGVLNSPEFQAVLVRYLRRIELALSENEEWCLHHADLAYWLVRIRMRTSECDPASNTYVRVPHYSSLTSDAMQPSSKDELADNDLLSQCEVEDRYPSYLRKRMPSGEIVQKTDIRLNAPEKVPKKHHRTSELIGIFSVVVAVILCLSAVFGQTFILAAKTDANTTDEIEQPMGSVSIVPGQLTSQSAKEGLPSSINVEATTRGKAFYDRVPAEQESEPQSLDEQSNSDLDNALPLMFGRDVAVAMIPSDGHRESLLQMSIEANDDDVTSNLGLERGNVEVTARTGNGQTDEASTPAHKEAESMRMGLTGEEEIITPPAAGQDEEPGSVIDLVIEPPIESTRQSSPIENKSGVSISHRKQHDAQVKQSDGPSGYHARVRAYSTRHMALEAYRMMASRHSSTMQDVPWKIEPEKTEKGTVYMLMLGPLRTWSEASKLCVRLVLFGESQCSVKA